MPESNADKPAKKHPATIKEFLDHEWVPRPIEQVGDGDEEVEIVLGGYEGFELKPVVLIQQGGPLGKAIEAQICASPFMVAVLEDLRRYFDGKGEKSSRDLKRDINAVLAQARPAID